MARFALVCPDSPGHLMPMAAVGAALQRRGHCVALVARPRAAALAAELGLPHHPLTPDGVAGISQPILWTVFCKFGAGAVIAMRGAAAHDALVSLEKLPPMLKEMAVDGVIADQVCPGVGTAAERAGLPFVTLCSAPPWNEDPSVPPAFTPWQYSDKFAGRLRNGAGYAFWRWFIRPAFRAINARRRQWELRPFRSMDESYSPYAQISQYFIEFDFPRSRMPDCFHYVGSLAGDRPTSAASFPWERLDGRPIIYASLGTIADPMNRPVYPRIAAACAELPAQLVIARGNWNNEDRGREEAYELPGEPLLVDYAPQLALMERAALVVTHAGLNTALHAISRGLPMVALPRNADQPGNAARIVRSGAGLCVSFHRGTPGELRRAIERVMSEEKFRRRAKELQQAMLAAGGAARAAEVAERAILTRQPVTGT